MTQKNRSTSSLLERRGSIMGARNLFSSSSLSRESTAEVEQQLQRPRTSAGAPEASPTKSRFSRLRYRRNRDKTTTTPTETESTPVVERQENQQRQRHQSTLEQLPEGAFLDFDDDASDSESRPSTSSSMASSVKSSGGWSWSMRSRRSSVSLKERWRASISSSSSSLSSSTSLSSASSYISSSSSSSSSSSTWDSLESTPRASIASSRTSYSSDDEEVPQKNNSGPTRPTKKVRTYVCRHFVSIPIPEEDEELDTASTSDAITPSSEDQHVQKTQQFRGPQPLPTPSPDENEDCITDPMADAFDIDDHLPLPHLLRPWAEPTPPPTPPLQAKELQLQTEIPKVPQSPPAAHGVPTFTITPASPIQPISPSPFSSSPPSATVAHRSFSAPVVGGPITIPANAPRRRSASNSVPNAPSSVGQKNKVEKGTPAMCPTCVKLQESMAQMRKTAGIYGPRHSLTVAAAKTARAARVAWAEAQWEASCVWEDDCDDKEAKSRKEEATAKEKKQKKVVSFQPSATFFVDREPFVEPKPSPSTAEGGDIASDEEETIDVEAQLQREMIIGQRLWGPLGDRGRKQRDFKRSMSESYVAGRWAPPARNEWLDTSGRTQTYEEFWAEGKHQKGKEGHHGAASVLLGGKVIRGVLGKFVPGGGAAAAAKKERERFERAERLERVVGLEVD